MALFPLATHRSNRSLSCSRLLRRCLLPSIQGNSRKFKPNILQCQLLHLLLFLVSPRSSSCFVLFLILCLFAPGVSQQRVEVKREVQSPSALPVSAPGNVSLSAVAYTQMHSPGSEIEMRDLSSVPIASRVSADQDPIGLDGLQISLKDKDEEKWAAEMQKMPVPSAKPKTKTVDEGPQYSQLVSS
jgi:hypothetical protein